MLWTRYRYSNAELSLTLAVVGLSAVAAWYVRQQSIQKNKAQKEQRQKEPQIQILRTENVRPLTLPTAIRRETLSEVDEWLSKSTNWLSFCIKFHAVLNYETVKTGLQRTLQHIPALAARIDASKALHELFLDPDNCGVVLEEAKGTMIGSTSKHLPNDTNCRQDWENFGLGGPSAGYEGQPEITDPLVRAKLITFDEKCSYLSVGLSHALCDGRGMADFLQTWSHFCETDNAESLPLGLRQSRMMGHRQFQPVKPAKSLAELERRQYHEAGCTSSPFTFFYFLRNVLFQFIWCSSRQKVVELRVDANKLKHLKEIISVQLEKDEWVSTYEVLVSAFLVATNIDSEHLEKHNLHVACDLRGRTHRFPLDYFGNAAFDFCTQLGLPQRLTWDTKTLAAVARAVHGAVRFAVGNPDVVSKAKDWFEAARHLGQKNKYDIWRPAVDALQGTGTFVNSWDPRFLEISMGSTQKASCMVAYFGMIQNFMVNVPRHRETKDSTIIMALPPKRHHRFLAFCEMHTSPQEVVFPFHVQESTQ